MKKMSKFTGQLLMLIIVLVLVNLLSERFSWRFDFTEGKIYTLSDATKDILKSLDEPVTITAYFTKGSQPEIEKVRKDFLDMLTEYANLSDGLLNFEFVNPNKDEQGEQEAMLAGIQPLMLNVREKDQVKQQRVFLGAKLAMGDRQELIPVIQPGAAMEYALSSAIKKLAVIDKPKVGFVQGHGEPGLNAMVQANEQLSVLYTTEAVNLSQSDNPLNSYETLVIVAPSDSFPDNELQQLDQYLQDGGNLLIAHNHVEANLQTMQGSLNKSNLSTWLAQKGLTLGNNFVVDASAGTVGVRQQSGFMTFTRQIPFHYWPQITKFEDSPATKGLNQVVFQFASTIQFKGDTSATFTPLVKTSEKSGTIAAPTFINLNKEWTNKDFPLEGQTIAAMLRGVNGNQQASIVLFSDGDFAVNGEGQQMQQLPADNVSLFVNAVDFLSDDTGLIDLRTKEITSRPLQALEDGQRNLLKWLNFLLPIILVLIFGLIRFQYRRNQRIKRMEVGHV
ncbi:MAG: Gldg family protein [Bacteroidales bacterium]|jgi:gliding-associated putative ABC transporter substrate-binding component GldG|nr:Gldg family protein [Bacteroidales bacterium]MDN5350431.1 gliding motility-associatede transport system auxiliary component [Bacteroidales bacterium]